MIAIIDDYANAVAEYYYDAWGKQTGCYGVMSQTLGKLNPFRYRGYVYDEETGPYYLQSRYYNRQCRCALESGWTKGYLRQIGGENRRFCIHAAFRNSAAGG